MQDNTVSVLITYKINDKIYSESIACTVDEFLQARHTSFLEKIAYHIQNAMSNMYTYNGSKYFVGKDKKNYDD